MAKKYWPDHAGVYSTDTDKGRYKIKKMIINDEAPDEVEFEVVLTERHGAYKWNWALLCNGIQIDHGYCDYKWSGKWSAKLAKYEFFSQVKKLRKTGDAPMEVRYKV